jgi:hypothetical protein
VKNLRITTNLALASSPAVGQFKPVKRNARLTKIKEILFYH